MKKQLWSLARLTLPALGFALTSSGAYLVSLQTLYFQTLMEVPVYGMIALGFVCMVSGVFWNVCHSMKSKMYQRGAPRPRIHIFTIDRSFPPSYEESQNNLHCWSPEPPPSRSSPPLDPRLDPSSEVVLIMAPPLYSLDSSEVPDCTWSWEPPPQYSQVEPCPTPVNSDP
ncbi:transmembrane protein 252-like [Periophthalmus magnuspinnatus]|uniref:transmembrane protein 252-like n=1 Tax=Periophthalmus magnuspinnatus TaxID=409849 RepID=UPI00145AE73C|nr:transmembrane protein 252-like [Periophthalmus magnuspinnatus]